MKMKRREKRGPTQHTAQPIETLPTPSPPVPYAHCPYAAATSTAEASTSHGERHIEASFLLHSQEHVHQVLLLLRVSAPVAPPPGRKVYRVCDHEPTAVHLWAHNACMLVRSGRR